MDINVGIVNYNTKELLADCLESIAKQDKSLLAKTIITDNGSSDGSVEYIRDKYPMVTVIASKENLGFAKAVNKILKKAKGKHVLLLNSDTILHSKSIESMVDFLERCPQAGAVGPMLLNPDGSLYPTGRSFPTFLDATMHAFLGTIAPRNRFSRRYKKLDWDRKNKKEVDWISGAAICLRREAVKEVGFFDEQYFMYVEDMDLCYRLWENGWKVFLIPEAKVTHYVGKSSDQERIKMIKEFQRSMYKFFLKQNEGNWKKVLAPLVKLGLLTRSALLTTSAKFRGGR